MIGIIVQLAISWLLLLFIEKTDQKQVIIAK